MADENFLSTNFSDEHLPLHKTKMMNNVTISPKTLGMYLGCDYQVTVNIEGAPVIRTLDAKLLLEETECYTGGMLLLREAGIITKEDAQAKEGFEFKKPANWSMLSLDIKRLAAFDLMRSIGVDAGGWILRDGKEVWTHSLISAGVAKKKEA